MLVRDIMTCDVQLLPLRDTVQEAAQRMRGDGIGSLLKAGGERVMSYVTDHDLMVLGPAERFTGDSPLGEMMSDTFLCCLPVNSRGSGKRPMGIWRQGDLGNIGSDASTEDAIERRQRLRGRTARA